MNTTRKERNDAHRAKMASKKAARGKIEIGFTPVRGALSDKLVHAAKLRGDPILPHKSMREYDRFRVSVAASINRRTGKPHLHQREIARRLAA